MDKKKILFSVALMYPQEFQLIGIFKLHFRALIPAVICLCSEARKANKGWTNRLF